MGGMGSESWIRIGSKTTVDSQHVVDICYFKKRIRPLTAINQRIIKSMAYKFVIQGTECIKRVTCISQLENTFYVDTVIG